MDSRECADLYRQPGLFFDSAGVAPMSDAPRSQQLLRQVALRLRIRSLARAVYWSLLAATVLYVVLLLTSRFGGLWTEWVNWQTFLAVPLVALIAAMVWHRRPQPADAARAVDQATGAKDLYLTLALLKTSAGEYQELVVQDAEQRAARIDAARVAPFGWQSRYWHAVWLPAAVVLGMLFLPQFDPFGQVAQASLVSQRQERLAQSREETQLRVAELKKQQEEQAEADATQQALDQLQLSLNKMQPAQKQPNLETLMDEQKHLGEMWRKLAGDQLKNLLKSKSMAEQMFGAESKEQLQKWTKELQEGSTESLKKELDELKEQLEKLAKTEDPVARQQLQKELKERLEQLEKFAKETVDKKELAAALQRAAKQLDLAKQGDLSKDALKAALESLELSEMELEQLAQAAQDLKDLEEALKTVQLAKRLNDKDKLDGQLTQGMKSLEEYEQFYKEMLAKMGGQCQGEGKCEGCAQCQGGDKGDNWGLGGRGIGKGGKAPEDDSIENDFKTELSKSAVKAGKVLMSMKVQGQGEKGVAAQDFRGLVQQVRQGASEAIVQEQIPPGYHDGIKSYFDALDKPDAKK
jgi:chemotaxis protein histidine kinase CheA